MYIVHFCPFYRTHKKIIDKSREFILKHSCNADSDTMIVYCCVKLFYVAASFWSH